MLSIAPGSQAVELTLGLSEADLANGDDASFAQLGGDSLAAIQFARAIDDLCGVPLPVSFVLDHSNSLAAITAKARAAAAICDLHHRTEPVLHHVFKDTDTLCRHT